MRALIVAASPDDSAFGDLALLARHADVVVACDGGATRCIEAGIEPSFVVGDMDSVEPRALGDVEIRIHPTDKDLSDLELAISDLRGLGVTELVMTGVTGGRLDHTLAAVGALMRAADLRATLVTANQECVILRSGFHDRTVIEGSGRGFAIVALGESAVVSTAGGRYTLDSHRLSALESLAISNTTEAHHTSIEVAEGAVLVMTDL